MVCALVLGGVGLSMGVHKLWLGKALIVRMKLGCLQDILWSENTQMQFCFAVMNPSAMTAPQSRKHWESTLFDHPQSCAREQRSYEAARRGAEDPDTINNWLHKYNCICIEHGIPTNDRHNFGEHSVESSDIA